MKDTKKHIFLNSYSLVVNMIIIGLKHKAKYLDYVDRYISQAHPNGLESLMVELPQNWPELSRLGIKEDFFSELANRYEQKGTRIVYGRADKISPPTKSFFGGLWFNVWNYVCALPTVYFPGKMDKGLEQAVKDEEPEVVVVGTHHGNHLKRRFPDAHYVAFDVSRTGPLKYFYLLIDVKPSNPDKIITLPR